MCCVPNGEGVVRCAEMSTREVMDAMISVEERYIWKATRRREGGGAGSMGSSNHGGTVPISQHVVMGV